MLLVIVADTILTSSFFPAKMGAKRSETWACQARGETPWKFAGNSVLIPCVRRFAELAKS